MKKIFHFLSPLFLLLIGGCFISLFLSVFEGKQLNELFMSFAKGVALSIFGWFYIIPLSILFFFMSAVQNETRQKSISYYSISIINVIIYGALYSCIGFRESDEYWFYINLFSGLLTGAISSYLMFTLNPNSINKSLNSDTLTRAG